jgi:hypothetical protein
MRGVSSRNNYEKLQISCVKLNLGASPQLERWNSGILGAGIKK